MQKSLFIALTWAFVAFIGSLLPVYAYTNEEIAEFARARDIRVGIEDYLHKELYPPRIYRDSTVTNIANYHGELDQKIDVNLEKKDCSIKLAFSKRHIEWERASKFLMKTVEEVLAICRHSHFNPDNIRITLFTDRTTLVGTGTYASSDNMIRVIPPNKVSRKKSKK